MLMSIAESPPRFVEEIANLLARQPSRDELLAFRPSVSVQQRAQDLLARQNEGSLSADEQHELDQFVHAELLMRLVKARLRNSGAT
jgi:hypothetical protein